ncbi:CHAT domain-containing protein [Streptomyces sp. URMC 129]|uniref:CHAT domain-containing protein n=1 Tax=Streptomyces sp. URMC 129 TaxID=3423407 RepID=UPI003F1DF88E
MTGSLPADVTVRVQRTAGGIRVEFRARNGTPAFRTTLASPGALEQARSELDAGLFRLKDAVPPLAAEAPELHEVFDVLHRLGRRLFFLTFGLRPDVIQGLVDFWKRALPFGRNPALPPLVECLGDKETFLPLEYLPLHRLDPGPPITGPGDFLRACQALVGFSCLVRRTMLPAPLPNGLELHTGPDGLLPLRYLHHEQLAGAKEELAWFASAAADRVRVEGPYPDGGDGRPGLPEQLYDPRLQLDGGRRELPDQIQHFACHCYAGLNEPLDNEIELRGSGQDVRLSLGTLAEDLVGLGASLGRRSFALPLVVMNACGSARMHAASVLSFPYVFLMNGNRGFVGSETEVPDDVAAAFSKALYERFLLRQLPLGRSLLEARRHLLQTYSNPLGIVYSSYADPQLRVPPLTDLTELTDKDAHAAAVP